LVERRATGRLEALRRAGLGGGGEEGDAAERGGEAQREATSPSTGTGSCTGATAISRWRKYDLVAPSSEILTLLGEVDRDPTCIFWG